ncbi:MAG: transcription-repair coupling factor [Planctomycetaceae bacterium]|nr:transcription-repair coupling factor [Planctomycetaceae bacterium]MBT6493703.1 transcription-repair coupling factor [Planctomycetaceae bacterium]
MAIDAHRAVMKLPQLVQQLHGADGFGGVVASLKAGESAAIDGAWGSSCALVAAALAGELPPTSSPHSPAPTLLVVLPRIHDVDDYAVDLEAFLGETPLIFPAWETLPQEQDVTDAVFGGRLRVLRALEESPPRAIVTSLPALLQPVPSRAERKQATRMLRVGDEIDIDAFLLWLVDRGFTRVPAIEVPGEFSMHGGIVDVYPPDAIDPLRLEFFGDELESIRRFDVESQLKVEDLEEAPLTLVAPVDASEGVTAGEQFVDVLPSGSWIVLSELQDLVDEGKNYLHRLDEPRGLFSVEAAMSSCTKHPTVTVAAISADSLEKTCHLRIESIERFAGPRNEVLEELAGVVGRDERVLIACHNEGERERLSELLVESEISIGAGVQLCIGNVTRGFRFVRERLVVLSDHELFGRTDIRRAVGKRKLETRTIDSFLELREGDLVAHLTHGIARYRGMKTLEKEGNREEHLVLEFAGRIRVFVPTSLIHLVQKYVGSAKIAPKLSKLGGSAWAKKKQKAAKSVMDLASDMVQLQAKRAAKSGIAYPPDSHWQREFEASFPYTETEDQLLAIGDFKGDMEQPRPMDRLICGDVGFGKTEVAMRAAFKTIEAGRQVAVLVPTTVLAEQHHRTFSERMAEYPVTVESISRFKTKKQQKRILEGMETGGVDLVIGTHRLIQKDVRFKDLGLLVIDEEQRFGVEAKEMLKQLRLEVDVLTLSATPIPRTLHMAVLGIRDISNLTTAPQARQAISTRLCRFDGELIRNAIVRELNRGGQIYFVHNRVYNIKSIADRIQTIVPEARIGIGHGQMAGHELEEAMLDFVTGKIDVLVCTTIIESGLDIPNANTILIHQADNYGLADLHQLRGRVGRSAHRAYCYLVLEDGRTVTPIAAKRLKAIEEFSELGAGFKIAMRDLEIRGAGNILGTEQSGHIAAVGYELYCQLLENAVRAMRKQPLREHKHVTIDLPLNAFLPDDYVPVGRHKIEMYRKLSNVRNLDEIQRLREEFRDRFGAPPPPAARLLEIKELQLAAQSWQIDEIRREGRFAVFGYRNPVKIQELGRHCGADLRIVDDRHVYLPLDSEDIGPDELFDHVRSLLRPS